jgi:5-formyltetrahydrofolate cyclo-ligase
MRARLRALPRARFAAAGVALAAKLAALPQWRGTRWLLGFAATGREPATAPALAAAAAAGMALALPRVAGRRLVFHRVDRAEAVVELVSGFRGIPEPPATAAPVALERLPAATLVLVPGAAFDRAGRRLGWGGGHYDRALHEVRRYSPAALLVGVCMPEQLVGAVPCSTHDVAVDRVVAIEAE